ncbi:serine hydrolase domain-containing protein [Chitinophaga qingshengii]|uniref:Beta-lactamase family protein n=1 Tax=Chitinophaga qingshengii TaxID=1569794 RepID=A0ABR7TS15_9BACT|nr:serine hydrolase domain-containing protein [Chitinophaga qingshengii]MBC9933271.1 beta-lactamase family protein [Chitinophaga qingshengii]
MKISSLLLVCLLSVTGFAQSIRRLDKSTITPQALTARIQQLMDTAQVTGMSIAIFNQDQPVYVKAFGTANKTNSTPMDTNTVFWACSYSKAVFAYCVMKLVDQHMIDLDTPLVKYLPKPLPDYVFTKKTRGYQDLRNDPRYEKITARMCLDHTTGFPNYRGFEANGKICIKSDPGTLYGYSGEGMYLLQFVLEQMTGKDYESIAREQVFLPLGMTHSSYVWQPRFDNNYCVGHDTAQHPYEFDARTSAHAAGSLYTNITDWNRFLVAMLTGKGLSRQSAAAMLHPQIPILSKKQFGPDAWVYDKTPATTTIFYGLGVGLLKTPYGIAFFKEGHSEGWGHYSIVFPQKHTAIAIMTNSDNGERIFKSLLEIAIGDVYTPWFWENYIPYNYATVKY